MCKIDNNHVFFQKESFRFVANLDIDIVIGCGGDGVTFTSLIHQGSQAQVGRLLEGQRSKE